VAIHIQPLRGWRVGGTFPTGCTCGYSYSTPSGLARWWHISHRLHLWLFIFNPFRVGTLGAHFPQVAPVAIHIQPLQGWHVGGTFPTGCTCGYSYSTPSGLARCGHISHRLHLWLFIFNPFRVGTLGAHFPQVAPVAIHIQPLRGWRVGGTFPTGCTWGYSQPLRGWRVGGHISHRLHLWLFTFNPYGVGTLISVPTRRHRISPRWG